MALIPDEFKKTMRDGAHADEGFNMLLDTLTEKLADTDDEVILDVICHLVARVTTTQEDIEALRGQLARLRVELIAKEEK